MELLAMASTARFLEAQRGYFERQGVCFTLYTGRDQLSRYSSLVIFIPVENQGQFVSPAGIWRQFLAKNHPETRLIISGVEAINHHNYLDLLNLPNDFSVFFNNLKAVNEKSWAPIETEALDMRVKLRRFYEGHGRESVTYTLSKIIRKTETLAKRLKEVGYRQAWKEIFEPLKGETVTYTEEKWNELIRRWEHYAPFFQYLPFKEETEEAGRRIEYISPFFGNNCREEELYTSLECKKNLGWLYDTLDTIKQEYAP